MYHGWWSILPKMYGSFCEFMDLLSCARSTWMHSFWKYDSHKKDVKNSRAFGPKHSGGCFNVWGTWGSITRSANFGIDPLIQQGFMNRDWLSSEGMPLHQVKHFRMWYMAISNLWEKVYGCSTILLWILQTIFENSNVFKEVFL